MTRSAGTLPFIALDPAAERPLYEQLYAALREHILNGRIVAGARLASSRSLAADLGISRFTVVAALDQLAAEGYLSPVSRGGIFVSRTLPDVTIRARSGAPSAAHTTVRTAGWESARPAATDLSRRGRAMTDIVITGPRDAADEPRPFRPRRPPLDLFPVALWSRMLRRQWGTFRHEILDYGDPAGLRGLREAIAEHAAATRGVRCAPVQVIITAGAQQAYNLLFQLLLDPGDDVWIEEPGYLDVRGALTAAGARLVPVPVDVSGLDVDAGIAAAATARLAIVSPSHQYPTGATMSASRRIQLIDWAHRRGAWIVEDDYDSYFRYRGRPLPALQRMEADRLEAGAPRGTAPEGRVVYVGTFSKTMFPSLRLGYCIVPPSLVDAVANARAVADRNSPASDQHALELFIRDGHYDRHLRRTRAACLERYEAIRECVHRRLGGRLGLSAMNAGTHVLGWIEGRAPSAKRVEKLAADADMVVFPLSRYCIERPARDALVLGYGGLTPRRIDEGVRRLARILQTG
jgi:GntR family transcriptional regulator/MocR family aminotransferase